MEEHLRTSRQLLNKVVRYPCPGYRSILAGLAGYCYFSFDNHGKRTIVRPLFISKPLDRSRLSMSRSSRVSKSFLVATFLCLSLIMYLSNNLFVVFGALPIASIIATPLGKQLLRTILKLEFMMLTYLIGDPSLVYPRLPRPLQHRSLAVPPPSNCETDDNITPWGTVETCGAPPVPKGHPSLTTPKGPDAPKGLRDYVTIITEADVTWCRPFPNTVIPALGLQFFKWTALNLTCWTTTDRTVTPDGKTTKDAPDIWVKTGAQGCYINENDLRAPDVNFPQFLQKCKANNGPHPLEPNPGPQVSPKPTPVQPAAASSALPASNSKPVEVASVSKPAEAASLPKPDPVVVVPAVATSATPSLGTAEAVGPIVIIITPPQPKQSGVEVASIPKGPQPERATPRPDATALITGTANAGATIASIPRGPQPERSAPRPDATALIMGTPKASATRATILAEKQPNKPNEQLQSVKPATIQPAAPKSSGVGGVQNIPAVVAKTVSGAWATPSVLPGTGNIAGIPDVVSKTVSGLRGQPTMLNPGDPAIRDSVW
jgi:hypothetical protein